MLLFTIYRCGDYLRLYVNLDRAEINEHNVYDFELCGNISHIDQKTYYSKGRSLVMEFHSDASHVNHTGFQGVFKFLDGSELYIYILFIYFLLKVLF